MERSGDIAGSHRYCRRSIVNRICQERPMPAAPTHSTVTRLSSPSGLGVEVNANGSLRRMDCGDTVINLFIGNELEGGPANLYLREVDASGSASAYTPLLGP